MNKLTNFKSILINKYYTNSGFGLAKGQAVFWPKLKLWPNLRLLAETGLSRILGRSLLVAFSNVLEAKTLIVIFCLFVCYIASIDKIVFI